MKGQSLVEVLVALALAAVIITGVIFAITSALNNAQFSRNQNLATAYAQQGMEAVRAMRDAGKAMTDAGLIGFFLLTGNYCLAKDSNTLAARAGPDCEDEGDIFVSGIHFIREIRFQSGSDCGSGNIKVTLQVQWSDSKCRLIPSKTYCHQAELISCFSNANVVPTP